MRWGLDRTRAMLDALGRPEATFRSLHVGGTNGKGSAAAAMESVLRADGRATGLYTSPHLFRVAERIQVGGRPAPTDLLERCAEAVLLVAETSDATYFEALTALCFLVFREAGVEWAAVEVGLGGRLDATNVLRPEVCALTSVALEHTAWLGDSLAEVAAEKAGIFKPDVPVALGPLPEAALEVAERTAMEVGAPVRRLGRDAWVRDVTVSERGTEFLYVSDRRPEGLRVRLPLPGIHQAFNVGTALLALEWLPGAPSDECVLRGVEAVRWRGRFEVLDRPDGTWILDVAHNPAAMTSLVDALERVGPPRPRVLLLAVLADKDWRSMLELARRRGLAVVLTQAPSAPPERRWDPARAHVETGPEVVFSPLFREAMERARELAGHGTVVVAGSSHTVADAARALDAAD
jgi:dihydrofolate synthase/folylpolyglutamate synthase